MFPKDHICMWFFKNNIHICMPSNCIPYMFFQSENLGRGSKTSVLEQLCWGVGTLSFVMYTKVKPIFAMTVFWELWLWQLFSNKPFALLTDILHDDNAKTRSRSQTAYVFHFMRLFLVFSLNAFSCSNCLENWRVMKDLYDHSPNLRSALSRNSSFSTYPSLPLLWVLNSSLCKML